MTLDGQRRGGLPQALLFLFLLGCVGFVLGTLTLRGPVRWITAALREAGAGQGREDWIVRGTIPLVLLVSTAVALLLAQAAREAGPRRVRWGIPAGAVTLAVATLALWLAPTLMGGGAPALADEGEGRFVIGAYPERAQLAALKARGFTGVVTLLHPAVVPFEPALLERERRAEREVGLELIEAPMLPWVSQNTASLARIRDLVRTGQGRFYVHCYLGKDRVSVVRRLLASEGVRLDSAGSAGPRRLADKPAFERGSIYHLAGEVHVTPYPTEEEWFGYVFGGSVRQVLSLLDPESPEDTALVAAERALTAQYRMPLAFAPIRTSPYDPQSALDAARRARSLPRPLMVHAFRTFGTARTEAFVQAYRTGLPPLPPSLFSEPMAGGAVAVVGVNVAVGPTPSGPELRPYLHARGVRGLIFVAPAGVPDPGPGASAARDAGLSWTRVDGGSAALFGLLARGGPWYLYGPGLATARAELDARLDVATDIPVPGR